MSDLVEPKRIVLRIKRYMPGPGATSVVMELDCGHPYSRSVLCMPRDGSLPKFVQCRHCPKVEETVKS